MLWDRWWEVVLETGGAGGQVDEGDAMGQVEGGGAGGQVEEGGAVCSFLLTVQLNIMRRYLIVVFVVFTVVHRDEHTGAVSPRTPLLCRVTPPSPDPLRLLPKERLRELGLFLPGEWQLKR
ncbi:hypothetical protein EYF80_054082 [Liparis tanakae]|uniref:Uncharacterized protein n=1 Tax=Liparis tanakae TaxID=230148 RepID=A0A4Z2F4U8_9TELE|nr:hypothetical protein EYF80_054082 [Liparis tanakae]